MEVDMHFGVHEAQKMFVGKAVRVTTIDEEDDKEHPLVWEEKCLIVGAGMDQGDLGFTNSEHSFNLRPERHGDNFVEGLTAWDSPVKRRVELV